MRLLPITAALVVLAAAQQPPADLIVYNARVYTVDEARPQAEAVAVRGSRIAAVGTSDDVLRLKGASTRVIDAGGAAVIPGLHDAHAHFARLGESLRTLQLRGTLSWEQIVSMVRTKAAAAPAGEWILGRSWDQNDWSEKEFPTHDLLSAAAPRHPVYLTRVDGHAAVANQAALDAAGITRGTPDPDGGRIIRDASGAPSGTLVDRAMDLVARAIPPASASELEERILLADAEALRLGLTMVHDAGTSAAELDAYRRLIDAGRLRTRIYVMLGGPAAALRTHFDRGPLIGHADHQLTVRAIKIVADGALGSRGAALLEPYADEPGNTGLLTTPPEEIYARTLAAARAGFQVGVHAIGDRANRLVMDVFERVQREVPVARSLRMRNEHAQILDAAEIPRFARLGVIASMQPTHATSDMPWVAARIGQARANEGAYVWQALLRNGATIASGSDFPVEEPNPMLGLYAAITRQDPSGQPPAGWTPDQRMTREQALRSFTADAAYAAHLEHELGSIAVGKLADLLILSKDVMRVPPREILTATVRTSVVGGRVVYP